MSAEIAVRGHFQAVGNLMELGAVVSFRLGGQVGGDFKGDGAGGGGMDAVDGTGDRRSSDEQDGVHRRMEIPDSCFGFGERLGKIVAGRDGWGEQNCGGDLAIVGQGFERQQRQPASAGMSDQIDGLLWVRILIFDDLVGQFSRLASIAVEVSQMDEHQKRAPGRPVVDFDCRLDAAVLESLGDVGIRHAGGLDARQDDRVAAFETFDRVEIAEIAASVERDQTGKQGKSPDGDSRVCRQRHDRTPSVSVGCVTESEGAGRGW